MAHVSACLANADLPAEEEQLTEALTSRAWATTVEVRNDTFAILRAGVTEPRGVAVVCGAGINCVGMRPDGRTARFPAVGRISGDWGGGWALAEEALWHAARADDGRGEKTALTTTLPAHFGVPDMPALIEALHLEHIPPHRRHEATPVLFATAAGATRSPAPSSTARPRRSSRWPWWPSPAWTSSTRRPPSSWAAASWRPGTPSSSTASAPDWQPAPPSRTSSDHRAPVLGAALLGLDHVSAPPETHARLRAHYG